MPHIPSYLCRSAGILGLVIALSACRRQVPQAIPKSVTTLLVLVDVSRSSGNAPNSSIAEQRCPEVVARVHQVMNIPTVKHVDLAVYATGDINRTGGEPTAVLPWRRFSLEYHLLGQHRSREQWQRDMLTSLEQQCREHLHEAVGSPLVLGVQRCVESLMAHRSELENRNERVAMQFLAVLSDLRDNYYPVVTHRVTAVAHARKLGRRPEPLPTNLPLIALGPIRLSLCGISEHQAKVREPVFFAEAITHVWRELLRSNTEPLTFEAVCAREPSVLSAGPVREVRR